jgi:cytochrome P450
MTEAARPLPSHFSFPLIGDTLSFIKDPGGFMLRRSHELGRVFKANILGKETVCLVGPEAFSLLLDDANAQRKGANAPHVEKLFDPHAVPFLDGEAHRRRKKLLMEAFTPAALEEYLPVIEQILTRYQKRWEKLGTFAFVPELNALGFNIAATLFTGADPEASAAAIETAFGHIAAGLLSIPVAIPGTPYARALKARETLLGVIDKAIAAHELLPGKDVLSRLLAARVGDEKLGKDEVRIETFHFFGAYAAVIGGLSMLAKCLAEDPAVAARVREEFRSELPKGPLTLEGLRKLEYLDRVCKESRRVAPTLAITFFGQIKRELQFDGIRIPKGVSAVGCIGATVLEERTYPDAQRFDPDRWINPTEQQKAAWIPHGGGVHTEGHRCAGEALATLMLKAFAVLLLRENTLQLLPGQDLSPTKDKLFATPAGGLQVRLGPV